MVAYLMSSFLALTFVLAPLPNALFAHCGADDSLSSSYEGSAPLDLGRFITAMVVVTGFALPIVLAHSEIINTKACVMAISGGGCVKDIRCLTRLTLFWIQVGICHHPGIFRSL